MRTRTSGFTLIELLVVIAIIALLIGILMPSLGKARMAGWQVAGLSNMRQLTVAVASYAGEFDDYIPPIQDRHPRGYTSVESTWRAYLFEYAGSTPDVFDSPAEKLERYADGLSEYDIQTSGGAVNEPDYDAYGEISRNEMYNRSGIGANLVHYWGGNEGKGPFGRPRTSSFGRDRNNGDGYDEGLSRLTEVEQTNECILFGDGGSSSPTLWPEDSWWIYKVPSPVRDAGFSRYQQHIDYGTDAGAFRYDGKANYTFADGSGTILDAREIPCNENACWWSLEISPHYRRLGP